MTFICVMYYNITIFRLYRLPVFVIVSNTPIYSQRSLWAPIYSQRSLWADDVTVLRRRTMTLHDVVMATVVLCGVARCTRNDVTVFRHQTTTIRDVIVMSSLARYHARVRTSFTEQNSHIKSPPISSATARPP